MRAVACCTPFLAVIQLVYPSTRLNRQAERGAKSRNLHLGSSVYRASPLVMRTTIDSTADGRDSLIHCRLPWAIPPEGGDSLITPGGIFDPQRLLDSCSTWFLSLQSCLRPERGK
ncbi:hypothetical protein B0H19DRAFT_65056 [Mycena capillaripes]|nr:hypothetical protein B0H19DRAFT_65056 [Mycena capillaripes]